MWSIDLPVAIRLGKKKPKSHPLNLNWYRNANFHTLNNVKISFADQIKPKVRHLPRIATLSLQYTLYPRTHQLCDTANVCCIVDKFFCDTLVDAGVLEDDNYTILGDVRFKFGAVDPKNPRVTVEIIPIEIQEQDNMKITLDETEIKQAVRDYVNNQVDVKPGQSIEIDFTAGRGSNGLTATVDISANRPSEGSPIVGQTSQQPTTQAGDANTTKPVERVNGKVVNQDSKGDAAQTSQEAADAPQDTTAAMAQGDHVAGASEAEAASPGLFSGL